MLICVIGAFGYASAQWFGPEGGGGTAGSSSSGSSSGGSSGGTGTAPTVRAGAEGE